MNAYVYQAGLYCEDCGREIRDRLIAEGKAPADPDDEHTYDSDEFPKGPYPDGGGEADSPAHCSSGEACVNALTVRVPGREWKVGCMLENPLTDEGVNTILESFNDGERVERNPVTREWLSFYASDYDIHAWALYYDDGSESHLLGKRYYQGRKAGEILRDMIGHLWDDRLDAASCTPFVEELD